ncbi:hypothetical protein NBZ79_12650 [Sneathiella marina]|uniref:Uncharacterized protein n=1 Tax=Sneathiella marina TaxID=2950108 RepID=A0ABY4VYM1_9PROT|nr:hypothetical protein [Sneathiella marina]USG60027.1 hypothetical protein NBZ79_12650 [Sneathiella marina]
MFTITQAQVDALETWVENRKEAYVRMGFHLAAKAGATQLVDYAIDGGLKSEDLQKSIFKLKEELELAEMFHKDARTMLNAGRQGG